MEKPKNSKKQEFWVGIFELIKLKVCKVES